MAKPYLNLIALQNPASWIEKERRHLLILASLAALLAVLSVFNTYYRFNPNLDSERAIETGTAGSTGESGANGMIAAPENSDGRKFRMLAQHLAKRYMVAVDATESLVAVAHAAGRYVGLDPLLIIAVIAVESRFNPIAESVSGAKGLMQVIPRYHLEKLKASGGENAILDPYINILVGAQILKEYIDRSGSLVAGLQMYSGAPNDDTNAYSNKVINEKERLQRVIKQIPV